MYYDKVRVLAGTNSPSAHQRPPQAILGSAVLFGMTTDLSLAVPDASTSPPSVDTSRLSWATSLFYFGMLAGVYPLTYLLQRYPLPRVLPPLVLVWALVCGLAAACRSHGALYAQRFFLGFIESVLPTAFMTIVSGSYTQREQALRQSWWFSSTGWWTILGGGLNYAFAQVGRTEGGLRGWQYLYIFAALLTGLFGVWCFWVSDSPATAWYLSPDERVAAVERRRMGQTGVKCFKFKWAQLKEGVCDIKVWLVALVMASACVVPPRKPQPRTRLSD